MSNKALVFWVSIGLTLVVVVVRLYILAKKREKESGQLKSQVSQLEQQNGILLTENTNLKNGNRWGG